MYNHSMASTDVDDGSIDTTVTIITVIQLHIHVYSILACIILFGCSIAVHIYYYSTVPL